uniref:DUF7041 domain-containing protein n=1 Tax=Anopheles atroparvus TaxID=41427 RepID=A0AAG5DR57_ANOAO
MDPPSETKHATLATETRVISKINIPDFDSEDIETWFICLEAAFCVNEVKSDRQKFNTVIVALGNKAKYMHAAIAKCSKTEVSDRYQTMKAAVLDYFRPSENQRLTSLLSGVSLGDRKPSVLLAEMRRMGGEGCSDSVIGNIWLRALPVTVRSIIAAMPSASLEDQANVADKIMEAPRNEIASVHRDKHPTLSLEERIDALPRRFEEICTVSHRAQHHGTARPRPRSRSRPSWGQRSTSSSRHHNDSATSRRWICWYHYRHGNKAEKCEKVNPKSNSSTCIFFEERLPVSSRKKVSVSLFRERTDI